MNRIVWATPALRDQEDILDYLVQDSLAAATRFLDQVDTAVSRLASLPHLGRVVPELERHLVLRYREVVLSPWRLIYRVEPDRVYVLAVIDGRRNVEDILLRRLLRT
jgi:plasmid stabilization system protein ParE